MLTYLDIDHVLIERVYEPALQKVYDRTGFSHYAIGVIFCLLDLAFIALAAYFASQIESMRSLAPPMYAFVTLFLTTEVFTTFPQSYRKAKKFANALSGPVLSRERIIRLQNRRLVFWMSIVMAPFLLWGIFDEPHVALCLLAAVLCWLSHQYAFACSLMPGKERPLTAT